VSDAIGTGTSAERLLREAGWPTAPRNVLVVGHQPTLGEVAARLLRSSEGGVSVRKGAVWWFSTRERDGKIQIHTRQSVLMRLLTHDAGHCGEISQTLGMHGLGEVDLWTGRAPTLAG